MVFARFFRRFVPPTLDDPVFGRLTFMQMQDPARSYWEGAGTFAPVPGAIEYFIDAGPTGPTASQHRQYRAIERRYPKLFAAIEPVVRGYLASWLPNPASATATTLTLESVSMPAAGEGADAPPHEWELTYSCDHDPEHLFTVAMLGWMPTGEVRADG